MRMSKQPKVAVGQVVFDSVDARPRKLYTSKLYPGGWYYADGPMGDWLGEKNLRKLTAREIGPRRQGRKKR